MGESSGYGVRRDGSEVLDVRKRAWEAFLDDPPWFALGTFLFVAMVCLILLMVYGTVWVLTR